MEFDRSCEHIPAMEDDFDEVYAVSFRLTCVVILPSM